MTAPHRFSAEEFEHIFSRVPRLCVDLVILTPQGIVLTLRALPTWHNQWHFPGGGVLYREKVTDAIQRIAQGEIGVSVTVEKLLGYMEFPSEIKERGFGNTVSLAFLCKTENTNFESTDGAAFEIRTFSKLPETMIKEQRAFLESRPEEAIDKIANQQ